jgi:predicted SprT family Zn-dependent metalloprotease
MDDYQTMMKQVERLDPMTFKVDKKKGQDGLFYYQCKIRMDIHSEPVAGEARFRATAIKLALGKINPKCPAKKW